MALTSSSPGLDFQSRLFSSTHHHPHYTVAVPSSPTLAYQDGEISPSFDASFASSMSLSSDPVADHSPIPAAGRAAFDLSPGLDAMDISPAPPARPPAVAHPSQSDRHILTVSRAHPPLERSHSQPAPTIAAPTRNYPYLKNLFNAPAASSSTSLPFTSSRSTSPEELLSAPPSSSSSSRTERELRPAFATLPLKQTDRLKPQYGTQGARLIKTKLSGESVRPYGDDSTREKEKENDEGMWSTAPLQLNGSGKSRAPIPPAWNARHTAPSGGLLQPPALSPVNRLSEPTVPAFMTTAVDSSPVRMDVDGSSPRRFLGSPFSGRPLNHPRSVSDTRLPDHPHHSGSSGSSGASDRIADFFSHDLSPIPHSRKRLLNAEHSPTPGSSSSIDLDSLVLGSAAVPRRAFEKASSTNSLTSHVARRRGSQNALGMLNKRPILASVQTAAPGLVEYKRHAQQLNGKPAAQKGVRCAYSVADAAAPDNLTGDLSSYRASMDAGSKSFLPPGRHGCTGVSASIDMGAMAVDALRMPLETGSPVAGFRTQEEKGKALPCFGVKEDGLMRINGDTLNRLQAGEFCYNVKQYLVIDCRFSYEFEGGHIAEAINLPTTAEVEQALLKANTPPQPSTSGRAPPDGKTVLIFHCEFSAKRAPTSATHLREQDRKKNAGDYPNIHYPEVYILQGGYADYYKSFPERCTGGYLQMDDPEHNAKRSVDLNSFRHQQKRTFNRASSFTFGEGRHAAAVLAAAASSSTATFQPQVGARKSFERSAALNPAGFAFPAPPKATAPGNMIEEEHESGDSSFGTNPGSSPGAGDSPCPTSKVGRHSLKIGKEVGGRRPLERAQTSSGLFFKR